MKRVSPYLKMRVLGAIEYAPGTTIVARIRHVAEQPFTDDNGVRFQFTWRTIQTWYSRYQKDGTTTVLPKSRSDKGKTRKMTPEEVLEAIEQVRPSFRGPRNVTAFYRACIERGQRCGTCMPNFPGQPICINGSSSCNDGESCVGKCRQGILTGTTSTDCRKAPADRRCDARLSQRCEQQCSVDPVAFCNRGCESPEFLTRCQIDCQRSCSLGASATPSAASSGPAPPPAYVHPQLAGRSISI